MPENDNVLTVENLGVKFNDIEILRDLNFSVKDKDVLAIVGPNGSGKSVFFRSILGLIPHSGKVIWKKGIKINYIPQKLFIERDFPLTVREFFKFKEKNSSKITETLRSVGIGDTDGHHGSGSQTGKHLLDFKLGILSGGELQRVLIAWSIIDNPDVLLFDEPTSGIDIGGEETIYNMIKKLNVERGLTTLIISHDLNIVYKYANNVVCINKDMICYGEPSLVLDPKALSKLYGGETAFYKHQH